MIDTKTDVRGHDHPVCASVVDVLARIGEKWTVMVVGTLSEGPLRYTELQRQVGSISQRMLTLTLKALEQDGLVNRTMYPTIPPRVDYELTFVGRSLKIEQENWCLGPRNAHHPRSVAPLVVAQNAVAMIGYAFDHSSLTTAA